MKYIPLFLLLACNHVCPPTTKVITCYDTIVRPVVDTLVIIQTYDSVPKIIIDTLANIHIVGTSEIRPVNLFSDGKGRDTVQRRTIVYYNENNK